jgi:hypothetical protein
VGQLTEFYKQVVILEQYIARDALILEEKVMARIDDQMSRIDLLNETFKDALLCSNVLYFRQEIGKLRS